MGFRMHPKGACQYDGIDVVIVDVTVSVKLW